MALETYYTFSADALKSEIAAGKYDGLRHFMFGGMGLHFEATTPQVRKKVQKLGQFQPFIAAFPQECMGQLVSL
jgi:hypothetical protein